MSSNNFIKKSAVVYKITCNNSNCNDSYVGCTLEFTKRKYMHKHQSKFNKQPIYQSMRNNGGFNNFTFNVLAILPNWETKKDYLMIEKHFIETLKPNCNNNIPLRTNKEWLEANKDKMKLYLQKYVKKNKQKINNYNLKWREKNRKKLADNANKWYSKNKEKVRIKNTKRINCLCGQNVCFHHFKFGIHKESKLHSKRLLNSIIESKKKLKHNNQNINLV